jgi:hypothetical protein
MDWIHDSRQVPWGSNGTILNEGTTFRNKLWVLSLLFYFKPHYMFRPISRPFSGAFWQITKRSSYWVISPWIHRVLMEFRVLRNFANIFSSSETGGLSRRAQLHGVSYLYFLMHMSFSWEEAYIPRDMRFSMVNILGSSARILFGKCIFFRELIMFRHPKAILQFCQSICLMSRKLVPPPPPK